MQVVIFELGEELLALDVAYVQSINFVKNVTSVPNSQEYVKGLINVRGNVVPLIDLSLLLQIESVESTKQRLIILDINEETLAIEINLVREIFEVNEVDYEMQQNPNVPSYIKGIIKKADKEIILIDILNLISNYK